MRNSGTDKAVVRLSGALPRWSPRPLEIGRFGLWPLVQCLGCRAMAEAHEEEKVVRFYVPCDRGFEQPE
jgi:hypothetical protein